jgi:hypothetical protein
LDGRDRLFSLQYFRTLPAGYILGCFWLCSLNLRVFLFYFDSTFTPPRLPASEARALLEHIRDGNETLVC